MSRNNDVFQVMIPTSGTIAANGSTLDDLALGQLGAFDYETNLAVIAPVRNFYFALGADSTGANAVKNDIIRSTGTHIQSKGIVSLTNQCYVSPVDKIVSLSGWTAACNTEYGVKFEIRNQEALRLNGYNQVVKNYTVVSPDCKDCDSGCPDGDCFQVASDLINLINTDEDAVVTAAVSILSGIANVGTIAVTDDGDITITTDGNAVVVAILQADSLAQIADKIVAAINTDGTHVASIDVDDATQVLITGPTLALGAVIAFVDTDTTGAVVAVSAVASISYSAISDAYIASVNAYNDANEDAQVVCPTFTFDVVPATFESFCDINLNYFFPRQTDIVTVAYEGFAGNSTVATVQEMVYEDGSGYDVKQLEYEAGGWNGKPGPYRVSEATGTALGNFNFAADQSKGYDMIHLSHDQNSVSGWRDDNHFQRTIIAVDESLDISDTIGAFVNTMTAGSVDPIVACVD